MQRKFLIIVGISIFAGILLLGFSIEKDGESYVLLCNHWVFSDHKTCKVLWRDQVPKQIQTTEIELVTIPAPSEFLRMNCEDLYMYQEPPSQDVADAWNTRLHECNNGQEELPVIIELNRWRQVNCMDILNSTMPRFENRISQQAFDIRWSQCTEIMEYDVGDQKNEN